MTPYLSTILGVMISLSTALGINEGVDVLQQHVENFLTAFQSNNPDKSDRLPHSNVKYKFSAVNDGPDSSDLMEARSDLVAGVGGFVALLYNGLVQIASSLALKTMMLSAVFGVAVASLGIDDILELTENIIKQLYGVL